MFTNNGLIFSMVVVSCLLLTACATPPPDTEGSVPSTPRATTVAATAGPRLALVIGNADYRGSSLRPLRNPINDARAMAEVLEKTLGYQVTFHENVSKKDFGIALRDFYKSLESRQGQTALVFYTGHGLLGADGRNYLIPVDADPVDDGMLQYEGIELERLLAEVEAAGPATSIFIIDACRNTPELRSRHRGAAQSGMRFEEDLPTGSLIAFATANGQFAKDYVDQEDAHSPYVAALLEHLPTPGLTAGEVFQHVRKSVLEKTQNQQKPWEQTSLTDNLYFVRGSSRIPAEGESAPPPSTLTARQQPPETPKLMETSPEIQRPLPPPSPMILSGDASEYLEDAQQGNANAQYRLGALYAKGQGVEQSYEQALYWYRKSAAQGNRDAAEARAGLLSKLEEQSTKGADEKLERVRPPPESSKVEAEVRPPPASSGGTAIPAI